MCGVCSKVVTSLIVTKKHELDEIEALPELIDDTKTYFRIDYVLADKGYYSEDAIEIVKKKGAILYVPIKINTVINPKEPKPALENNTEANLSFLWEHFYHERSAIENVFSAIKKKIYEKIGSKDNISQNSEVYCKFIIYNIERVIAYYYVLDGFSKPENVSESVIKWLEDRRNSPMDYEPTSEDLELERKIKAKYGNMTEIKKKFKVKDEEE